MADLKISQFEDGGAISETDEIATNRGGINTKVFVGTAAARDVGTGSGDIPSTDDLGTAAYLDTGTAIGNVSAIVDIGDGTPGLAAVDGSLLTGVTGLPTVKITSDDTTADYLGSKIAVLNGITKTVTDPASDEALTIDVRHLTTTASVGTGTHTVNINNGDFHEITATGTFAVAASMENAQAVIVRAINFDDYLPTFPTIDWGAAGIPEWTGKDDFIIYRDPDGSYKATVVNLGLS